MSKVSWEVLNEEKSVRALMCSPDLGAVPELTRSASNKGKRHETETYVCISERQTDLLGNSTPIGRNGGAFSNHVLSPSFGKREVVVARGLATVGRDVVPLQQHQVSLQVVGKLELVGQIPIERVEVRTLGIVGILGESRIVRVRDELERMLVEAGLVGHSSGADGTRMELKVTLVMRREGDLEVDDGAGLVARLSIGRQISPLAVLRIIVVARVGDDAALGVGAAAAK